MADSLNRKKIEGQFSLHGTTHHHLTFNALSCWLSYACKFLTQSTKKISHALTYASKSCQKLRYVTAGNNNNNNNYNNQDNVYGAVKLCAVKFS